MAGHNTAEPYPDDTQGVYSLYYGQRHYGNVQPTTNLFASAEYWRSSDDSICSVYDGSPTGCTGAPAPVQVCRGQTISNFRITAGDNGSYYFYGNFRVFLSDTTNGSGNQWNLISGTVGIAGWTWQTGIMPSFTVPYVSPGVYWILWEVDSGHTTTEYVESDNIVHGAMYLVVNNC